VLKLWPKSSPVEVSGEAFGVGLTLVASDRKLLDRMVSWLPPQWTEGGEGVNPATFRLTRVGADAHELDLNGSILTDLRLDDAIDEYERGLRNYLAAFAPSDHLFVHAGVVALEGRAIVRAGAVYYSDEYAVFDSEGLVHAYPKPISMRSERRADPKTHHTPEALGAAVGDRPTPLGMVVCTQYRSGAIWEPEELTPAQAALELVQHSRAPQEHAPSTLATLVRAVAGTIVLKGSRGDADETATALLARLMQTADNQAR
jgi:hypothetical protein